MSEIDQNNSAPPTQESENVSSLPSQQSQIENVDKTTSSSHSDATTTTTTASNDDSRSKPQISPINDFVVQIAANNTNKDEEEDESVWGDQPTTYNLTRKLSNAEEDVCYPLRSAKHDGINYEALEEYITEERMLSKQDEGHLSPVDSEPRKLSLRRVSEFGERIKNANEIRDHHRFVFYSIASGTIKAKTLADIPSKGKTMTELLKQGIFWLDVLAPTESEMRILSTTFHIHPLTMEDIETEESREKCEVFKNYYFISFRSHDNANLNTADVEPVNMYNVVMREGILSFHFQPTPHQHNVRNRIRQLKDFITVTPDWINYAIMDDITDYFAPLMHKVEFESDAIDQLVMVLKKSEQQDMLVRIGLCRKMVLTLTKMLGTKVDVVRGLIKRCEDKLLVNEHDRNGPGDVSLYLGDVQDHLITMLQNLNHYENMLSRAHSNYLAQISIEITQLSNKTNDVLNRMTVFGTILLPMNVVTGLFGMNVHVPGQDGETLTWFLSIIGVLTVIGVFGAVLARKVGLM